MHGCSFGSLFGFGIGPMALVLVVLVVIAYAVFTRGGRSSCNHDRRDSLEILKRRLASGEISVEEYDTLRKYL